MRKSPRADRPGGEATARMVGGKLRFMRIPIRTLRVQGWVPHSAAYVLFWAM